jgi:hypothetical protein
MPSISINELHQLTGKTRATVTKALDGLAFTEGPKAAKLYDSKTALEKIYHARDEDGETYVSNAEANRLLTIARREQIIVEQRGQELKNELTAGALIPTSVAAKVASRFLVAVRQKILSSSLTETERAELLEDLVACGEIDYVSEAISDYRRTKK